MCHEQMHIYKCMCMHTRAHALAHDTDQGSAVFSSNFYFKRFDSDRNHMQAEATAEEKGRATAVVMWLTLACKVNWSFACVQKWMERNVLFSDAMHCIRKIQRGAQDQHDVRENIFSSVFHLKMRTFPLSPREATNFPVTQHKKRSVLLITRPQCLFVPLVIQSDRGQRYTALKKFFPVYFIICDLTLDLMQSAFKI